MTSPPVARALPLDDDPGAIVITAAPLPAVMTVTGAEPHAVVGKVI